MTNPKQFRVVWDEWTGTAWMRRRSGPLKTADALDYYNTMAGDLPGFIIVANRNVCIEEIEQCPTTSKGKT